MTYVAICAGFVLLTGKALARVRPPITKDQRDCHAAYDEANQSVQAGHLIEAKELTAKCAREACGNFLYQACTSLHSQLDAELPSVVPIVTDKTGAAVSLVEVKMDGQLLTSRLDGLALRVDPGKHEFSFGTDAGVFATRKVMILQGEHNRPLSVMLGAPRRKIFVASGRPMSDVAHRQPVHPEAVISHPAAAARREIAESEVTEADVVLAKDRRTSRARARHDHNNL